MSNRKSFSFGHGHLYDAGGGGFNDPPATPSRRANSLVYCGSSDLLMASSPTLTETSCDSSSTNSSNDPSDKLKVLQQASEIKELQHILNEVIAQRNALLCEVEQLKFQAVAGELCQIDRPSSSLSDMSSGIMGASQSTSHQRDSRRNSSKKQDTPASLTSTPGSKTRRCSGNYVGNITTDELDHSGACLEPEIEFSLICQDLIGLSVDDDSKLR